MNTPTRRRLVVLLAAASALHVPLMIICAGIAMAGRWSHETQQIIRDCIMASQFTLIVAVIWIDARR